MKKVTKAGLFKAPFIHRLRQHLNDGITFFKRRFGLGDLSVRFISSDRCFTDGEVISLGTEFPLFSQRKDVRECIALIFGVLFHEIGHLLYTPFSYLETSRTYLFNGSFYPREPGNVTSQIKDFLTTEEHRARAYTFYKALQNILEDGRIENALQNGPCSRYRRYCAGLKLARTMQWEMCAPLEESLNQMNMEEDDKARNRLIYEFIYSAFMQLVFHGQLKECKKEHLNEPIVKDLVRTSHSISKALFSETADEFQDGLNESFCSVWKYIQPFFEDIDDNEDGDGNGESLDEDGSAGSEQTSKGMPGSQTPKTSSAAGEPLAELAKKFGILDNQAASDKTDEVERETQKAKSDLCESRKNERGGHVTANPSETSKDDSNEFSDQSATISPNISDELAENPFAGQTIFTKEDKADACGFDLDDINRIVTEEDIKEQKKQERLEELSIQNTDFGSVHRNVSWHINAVPEESAPDAETMYQTFSKVVETAKDAAERLKEILDDAPKTYFDQGHFYGQRLNSHRFYDPSMRYFDRRINIPGSPTLSVAILVDQSGSMGGDKVRWVKAMAIMLFEMCRILDVPYAVFGHNASCSQVYIDNYCYFGDVSEDDKYKLLKIHATRCNRDGAALRYTAEKLAKRSEQRKLLFIISDGQPNDDGYCGEIAKNDIQDAIAEYERHGVKIIAAAIDQDKESIREIYGSQRFLDISVLDDLPELISEIVLRNVT